MAGWIKLHRELLQNPVWTSEPFTRGQAWVDLLMLAAFKENFVHINGRRIDLKPGQLCWSKVKLAQRWGWSKGKLNRYFTELQTDQRIDHQNLTVTSVITILNWDKYQQVSTPDGTPNRPPDGTPDGPPDGTQTKKVNKLNNEQEGEEDQQPQQHPFNSIKFWQGNNCYYTDDEHWYFDQIYDMFTRDFLKLCISECKKRRKALGYRQMPCKSDIHEWIENNKDNYEPSSVFKESS